MFNIDVRAFGKYPIVICEVEDFRNCFVKKAYCLLVCCLFADCFSKLMFHSQEIVRP